MLAKSSAALVFARHEGQIVGYNFLQKSAFECSPDVFSILNDFDHLRAVDGEDETEAGALLDVGALVQDADASVTLEEEYLAEWKWGMPTAMMHFSVQGNEFLTSSEIEEKQIETAAHTKSPPLCLGNEGLETLRLGRTNQQDAPLMALMAKRRSVREVEDRPVSVADLGEILFSGMGITGFTKNCVGELPLKMTPSGGARNPYEAYVIARNVEGLAPGVYHYSAMEHSLGRLHAHAPNALGTLVGGQDWADNMACIIVLGAFMNRTMWKYNDPNAYRVMLIEAGHIGQNMMLTGTDKGMTVCPTAALCHEPLFDLLDLPSRITSAPIYALAVGYPKTD